MSTNKSQRNVPRGRFFGQIKANITAKLILAMVLMALLPLIIVGFFINRNTTGDLEGQAGRSMQEAAVRTADLVAQTLAENIHLLETLAVSGEIQSRLRQAIKPTQVRSRRSPGRSFDRQAVDRHSAGGGAQ